MTDVAAERATEIQQLTEELAVHQHAVKVRALREQIAEHAAALAPPVREWHRVEFLSAGKAILSNEMHPETKTFKPTGEYEPRTVVAEGYLVIEDGALVAVVDLEGKELQPHEHPAPEHRVRTLHTSQPYPDARPQ